MTSDAKVRRIVSRIAKLSKQRANPPPEMSWFDEQFDPADGCAPELPFSVYLITGTAGAGKSTSVNAVYQNLNALITGATTVAAQNLSRSLRSYCPTVFNAFGFRSRHIAMPTRPVSRNPCASIEQLQREDLTRYWPIIADISREFMRKKARGMYTSLDGTAFNMLCKMGPPSLWTTNIIVIDEAGTLSSYILTAVVYFYWFFNSWLNTPLYRQGSVPCIVCVGSPTQTDAFESTYDHGTQKHNITQCDNILSFLVGNTIVREYAKVTSNWALFINNKRCTDPEFCHLLKVLEYNLPIPDDLLAYINRFVVPRSQILDPLQYVGWTRLFLSHEEVKSYLSCLHAALGSQGRGDSKLFTCPIICEVYTRAFEDYKRAVNIPNITVLEWLSKNLFRLSNYSQFIDQDMTAVHADTDDSATRVTYLTKFVLNSYVSLNGKTKRCLCGYMGTVADFRQILESESFIEAHSHDQPEFVYAFLNTLIFNGLYNFYQQGLHCKEFITSICQIELPDILQSVQEEEAAPEGEDPFYFRVSTPPSSSSTPLPTLIAWYDALKRVFFNRADLAQQFLGSAAGTWDFQTFTVNMVIRDSVDFTSSSGRIFGMLDYASTVESYRLKGYTFVPVNFGRPRIAEAPSMDPRTRMPNLIVQDAAGFVACLENNVNKLTESLEDGSQLHLCSASDYGVSSKLAMTIVKAQGISLEKVAVSFGKHRHIKKSHVYVAISRAVNPKHVVLDCNPLLMLAPEDRVPAATHIVKALHNPECLLVY